MMLFVRYSSSSCNMVTAMESNKAPRVTLIRLRDKVSAGMLSPMAAVTESHSDSAADATVGDTSHDKSNAIVTAAPVVNVVKNEVPDFMMRWIGK